jgi:hypothetical protein
MVEQPPEVADNDPAEDVTEEEEETPVYPDNSISLDEEAAGYRLPKGKWAEYRDLHAIYSDTKNAAVNHRYLRMRAQKVFAGDEKTKEMCHRYLMSIGDEEYMSEVNA